MADQREKSATLQDASKSRAVQPSLITVFATIGIKDGNVTGVKRPCVRCLLYHEDAVDGGAFVFAGKAHLVDEFWGFEIIEGDAAGKTRFAVTKNPVHEVLVLGRAEL